MFLSEINPFIRFACKIQYLSSGNEVYLRDCRMHYIIEGVGTIIIKNQHFPLKENTLIYCRSGSVYNIISESGLSLYAINFDLKQNNSKQINTFSPIPMSDKKEKKPIGGEIIEDSDQLSDFTVIENAEYLRSDIERIIFEYESDDLISHSAASAIMKLTLISLHRNEIRATDTAARASQQVIDYINENYKNDIDNRTLAAVSGYHEYYLGRIFLKHTGTTLHKYILKKRLSEARKLLLTSDDTMECIAAEMGFSSGTHFSIRFKKEFGISPSEFRKQHRKNI